MSTLKPAAMLSSGLLARKGAAIPALLGLTPHVLPPVASPAFDMRLVPQRAPEPVRPVAPPAPKPVAVAAQPVVAKPIAVEALEPSADPGKTVKLSLRLGPERHRKLRLVSFRQGRSAQQLLVAALDAYFDESELPLDDENCACLKRRGDGRRRATKAMEG